MSTISRIKELAKEQGRSMSYLCRVLGYKSRTYFNDLEKQGRSLPADKLEILADIFGVSVDYLLEKTEVRVPCITPPMSTSPLTNREVNVIGAYRAHPEMQSAVDKLLGISDEDEYIELYAAANSDNNRHDGVVRMTKEQWDKIKNTPYTDESLI